MKTRLLILFAALMPLVSQAGESSELELMRDKAQAVLDDHGFYETWSKPGALDTVDKAKRVQSEAKLELQRVDDAFGAMKYWCNSRFFVNACIDEAREEQHVRKREIREINLKADDVIRTDRTVRTLKRQAEREAQRGPVDMTSSTPKPVPHLGKTAEDVEKNYSKAEERRLKEDANLRAYEKKQREAAERANKQPEPARMKARERQAPTMPQGTPKAVVKDHVENDEATMDARLAQEEVNTQAYEQKQADARARMAEAEAAAAKRRTEREARQKSFNETLKARREAQERYEETKGKRESGLERFF